MSDRNESHARLWIQDRDSLGNAVDHRLIEAAHRVWERARLVVVRYLADDTEAPEIVEAAVYSASRAMNNDEGIELFDAYLLRSVAREAVRRLRRNRRIRYMDGTDLARLAGAIHTTNFERRLDETKRIEVFRACMDEQGRTLYDLRVVGYEWRMIAILTGYSDAHTAEVQFGKKMARALERFRMKRDF
jgi:DNA-directed RNA polymerase specialized sigma24 family protein